MEIKKLIPHSVAQNCTDPEYILKQVNQIICQFGMQDCVVDVFTTGASIRPGVCMLMSINGLQCRIYLYSDIEYGATIEPHPPKLQPCHSLDGVALYCDTLTKFHSICKHIWDNIKW